MQIFDNQYHVLKYFCKPIMLGKIFLAHIDCLKTDCQDYQALASLKAQKDSGTPVNEVKNLVDAKFDYEKVKVKFAELQIMDGQTFDDSFNVNVKAGYIGSDMTPTPEGIQAVTDLQAAYMKSPEYLATQKNQPVMAQEVTSK